MLILRKILLCRYGITNFILAVRWYNNLLVTIVIRLVRRDYLLSPVWLRWRTDVLIVQLQTNIIVIILVNYT